MKPKKILLTPGPTELAEATRMAMARPILNPDLDTDFFQFFRELTAKLQRLMHTKEDVLILNGEGILGLEAAVAALVEPGDEVLVLDNGFFGHGFADFVSMYGGKPIFLSKDYHQPIRRADLEEALALHPNIKIATMVHCDTPTGMLNPIEELVPLLRERGILSIVDAVASLGGDLVEVDAWGIDICCCGSQKAISAPPGLTLMSVSSAAWAHMAKRSVPIPGFYVNLLVWKNGWLAGKEEFPYTMPISDLYALDAALDLLLRDEDGVLLRHHQLAEATKNTFQRAGFTLWSGMDYSAHTVTAVELPAGVTDEAELRQALWAEHGVMIGGSWGELAGKVWRVGHMGEGADAAKLYTFFVALEAVLTKAAATGSPWPQAAYGVIFAEELRKVQG